MKKQMFKSALSMAAAIAAGSAFAAVASLYTEDFESPWTTGDLVTTDAQWTASGANDASAIAAGNNGQVLELKTEGDTLTNEFDGASDANTAISEGAPVTFEAEIKFVPSDNLVTDLPEGTDDTKFALYAYAPDGGNATNLVVYHASSVGGGIIYTNDIIDVEGQLDDPEAFTKVSVKLFANPDNDEVLYFEVSLNDGEPLEPTCPDEDGQSTWFRTVNDESDAENTMALSSICFKGTGMVDNLAVKAGEEDAPTTVTITLNAGTLSAVGLMTNGVAVADDPLPSSIVVPAGTRIAYTVANADGAQKTVDYTAGNSDGTLDASGETFGWPEYLGALVNGAYEIDDFADLDMLRKGVAAGLATAGETFKQTANIDMTSAGAFAGIGTFSKVPTAGTPFLGTYDGQGYTIANVTRAGENTQGIFNQVGVSGVIENLVVSNMAFGADVTGEYGFAIVGNAGGGATLRNLTAAGVFGSAAKPSTHNMAGIVVRLSPGATAGAATTVDSCTNNATIYGAYTKLGGINAIVQDQTGFKDGKVVFVNCANNGTLVCKRTKAQAEASAVTGNAGIVGYISGTNVELTNCYGNGAITNVDGANTDKDGALVGWTYGGTIKDNGGNSAPSDKKMIGTWGSATETGFLYATVDNGVATTVVAIAADGEYLLEGNAAPVIELADGESIAFDTALGYTLDDTGITAATGLDLTDATVGTVTTYTAAAPAPAGWVDNPETIPADTTVATQYPALADSVLATADAKEVTEWAATNNVDFAAVAAATSGTTYVEAFLLNCAPTAAAVEAEKEAFVLTITFENGVPVVSTPAGKTYNGTVQLKGSTDLSTWTNVNNASADYNFYKCELTL